MTTRSGRHRPRNRRIRVLAIVLGISAWQSGAADVCYLRHDLAPDRLAAIRASLSPLDLQTDAFGMSFFIVGDLVAINSAGAVEGDSYSFTPWRIDGTDPEKAVGRPITLNASDIFSIVLDFQTPLSLSLLLTPDADLSPDVASDTSWRLVDLAIDPDGAIGLSDPPWPITGTAPRPGLLSMHLSARPPGSDAPSTFAPGVSPFWQTRQALSPPFLVPKLLKGIASSHASDPNDGPFRALALDVLAYLADLSRVDPREDLVTDWTDPGLPDAPVRAYFTYLYGANTLDVLVRHLEAAYRDLPDASPVAAAVAPPPIDEVPLDFAKRMAYARERMASLPPGTAREPSTTADGSNDPYVLAAWSAEVLRRSRAWLSQSDGIATYLLAFIARGESVGRSAPPHRHLAEAALDAVLSGAVPDARDSERIRVGSNRLREHLRDQVLGWSRFDPEQTTGALLAMLSASRNLAIVETPARNFFQSAFEEPFIDDADAFRPGSDALSRLVDRLVGIAILANRYGARGAPQAAAPIRAYLSGLLQPMLDPKSPDSRHDATLNVFAALAGSPPGAEYEWTAHARQSAVQAFLWFSGETTLSPGETAIEGLNRLRRRARESILAAVDAWSK